MQPITTPLSLEELQRLFEQHDASELQGFEEDMGRLLAWCYVSRYALPYERFREFWKCHGKLGRIMSKKLRDGPVASELGAWEGIYRIRGSMTLSDFYRSIEEELEALDAEKKVRLVNWLTPILRSIFDGSHLFKLSRLLELTVFSDRQAYHQAWNASCVRLRCDALLRDPEAMMKFVESVCARLNQPQVA